MNRCAHCFGDLADFAVFCPHCARAYEPDFTRMIQHTTEQPIAGRYRLYRRLGQGGLSTVFAATDLKNDCVVVVKVSDPAQLVQRELSYAIDAEAARNYWWEMLERMRHEAETLAEINHPNIVRFYDTGLIGTDLRYVVMELMRGRTLREKLDVSGKPETAEAIRIALGICAALSEVHARGIVHRDINPRNVIIADSEPENLGGSRQQSSTDDVHSSTIRNSLSAIKLIDFGIAKFPQPPGAPPFTQHSVLSGTVAYASPEQCQSSIVDRRSDIYSLGIVLYEMLTGARPFAGRTPTEIALKQIQAEPVPLRQLNPDLPASLEKAVLRALEKNTDDRQQSIEELAEQLRFSARQIIVPLQADQADDADADENPNPPDRLTVVRRRRRRVAVVAAALLLLVVAAGILFGKEWLASRFAASSATDQTGLNTLPSPSPVGGSGAIGSDADSLELAAQLPPDSAANKNGTAAGVGSGAPPQASPSVFNASPSGSPSGVGSGNTNKQTANTSPASSASGASLPGAKPNTPPTSPKVQPSATPAPAIVRAPQPSTAQLPRQSEAAQAQHKAEERDRWQRESENSNNNSKQSEPSTSAPSARRDRIATNRDGRNERDEDDGASRHSRNSRVEDASDDDADNDDDASQQLGPKLIQWSGSVNREREITIELPGRPGTLEIPRVYRNRVGMIEPPSGSNRWRYAKLRIFGQGGVSIVVRWWPMGSSFSKLNTP